ncbi:MAG: hypothetical protein ACREO9_11950, partial [Lysobacterales bacterium]
MRGFLTELRRRNVLRVAAAYVVGSWVLVQAADILLPTFDAPPATLRVLTLLLTLFFPVALALAWTFELTSRGVIRDTGDNIDRTARVRVRRKTDYAILALAVAGVAGIIATRDWSGDLAQGSKPFAASGTEERLSIAVLPFRNVSSADSDEPLADGIAETLIHLLGQVKGLRVTSRSSSFTFRDGKADASTIGAKLGVSSILEGSLQRSGEMLRIIASLIDTKTGSQLWTAQFDRTLDNLFEVQDEIGRSVVEALNVSLLNEEHASGLTTFRPGIEAY